MKTTKQQKLDIYVTPRTDIHTLIPRACIAASGNTENMGENSGAWGNSSGTEGYGTDTGSWE